MAGSSIFSSSKSEERWVDQLNKHFVIYVDNPPSIFQVPKRLREENPEAYIPQEIGIGAYHHLQPHLDDMETRKLKAVTKFLKQEQRQNFKSLIVDKVRTLEPFIRSCYNKYLNLDGDTLAWVMAIDGVYLLQLLSTYSSGTKTLSFDDRKIAQDIFMMENQLPTFVLKVIMKALQPPEGEDNGEIRKALPPPEEEDNGVLTEQSFEKSVFSFCQSHTPLHPFSEYQIYGRHILDIMYSLIRLNWSLPKISPFNRTSVSDTFGQVQQVAGVAAGLTGLQAPALLANLPLQEFFDLFKKDKDTTTNSAVEEIEIPSASQLFQVAKVEFQLTDPDHSGSAVKYEKETRKLYLPEIRLNTDSEVILRNLVAYELASGSNNVVSGYVDFMCGIIDTAKDVDLLKEKGIIKSVLASEEIAKMFNSISKSGRMEYRLEGTTQNLNETYNNTFRVRSWTFIKNHLIPSEATLKIVLGILLVLLLTVQAFCNVYGCSTHWFTKISSVTSI